MRETGIEKEPEICAPNLLSYPSSTHMRALSQFLLHIVISLQISLVSGN
jgi:hypothetical protein